MGPCDASGRTPRQPWELLADRPRAAAKQEHPQPHESVVVAGTALQSDAGLALLAGEAKGGSRLGTYSGDTQGW